MFEERGKVITSLRHRLSIEASMRQMLEATSSEEFEAMAERIARRGSQVVPVIVANLDTTDARFRGVLGNVARHLERSEISYALREVVMQPWRTDQERTTALMILERFLDEEVGDSLYLELTDPLEVARQSLREVVSEGESDPQAYVEYVRSLEDEPLEVALLVLQAGGTMDPATVVEPLRLLAQDPRQAVAREAIRLLGTIRTAEALVALRCLLPCLNEERRGWAERSLRKLTLAGVKAEPPLPLGEHCRLLVSPVEGQGTRSVWVLEHVGPDTQINLLTVMLEDGRGITDCFGAGGLTETPLNWAPELGAVHRLSLPRRGYVLDLLEADPGYAVRLLLEGTAEALKREGCLPLAYRVWGKILWQYSLPPPRPFQEPEVADDELPQLLDQSRRLLTQPAFDSWAPLEPWTGDLLRGWDRRGPPTGQSPRGVRLACRLIQRYWDEPRLEATRRWLLANSEWFLMAGEGEMAKLALAAARGLATEEPTRHPLLLALAERALVLAWDARQRGNPQ
ncbi:MAG: HEAT repeat domain-containing protein [Anaerolineae bacterium]